MGESGTRKPSTSYTYRHHFDRYVKPAFGGMRVKDLRASHLDRLYGNLLDAGLSPGTVTMIHAMLSGALAPPPP